MGGVGVSGFVRTGNLFWVGSGRWSAQPFIPQKSIALKRSETFLEKARNMYARDIKTLRKGSAKALHVSGKTFRNFAKRLGKVFATFYRGSPNVVSDYPSRLQLRLWIRPITKLGPTNPSLPKHLVAPNIW